MCGVCLGRRVSWEVLQQEGWVHQGWYGRTPTNGDHGFRILIHPRLKQGAVYNTREEDLSTPYSLPEYIFGVDQHTPREPSKK